MQAWFLSKMQVHQPMLVALSKNACDLVHRDAFTQSLGLLGLTGSTHASAQQADSDATSKPNTKYAQVILTGFSQKLQNQIIHP